MSTDEESDQFEDSSQEITERFATMESILQPPPPFLFENNVTNVTSGNLSAEWEEWKKSFKIYFEACELSKKSKKVQLNILLHVIGSKCREVYEQFTEEIDSVEILLKKFDDFFVPIKNLAVERHKFFKRNQKELESTEQYIFELNKIASKCEFKELCEDLVCSRFICGVRDVGLSERLLREPEISLKKAVEICKLAEMSRMHAQNIKTNNEERHVHEILKEDVSTGEETLDVHQVSRRSASQLRRPPHKPTRSNALNGPRERQTYHNTSVYQPSHSTQRPTTRNNTNRNMQSEYTPQVKLNNYRQSCENCGRVHRRMDCPAFGARCNNCNRMNHYARMCRSSRRVYQIQEDFTDQDSATS